MKRTWPIVAVHDVQASSGWYQSLLGCANNHPGSPAFDQIIDTDGGDHVALQSARTLVAGFEEEPHVNPNTHTMEFSVRDPDGYYVTISATR